MTSWTTRLLLVLTLLVSVSVGLQLAVLYRLLPEQQARSALSRQLPTHSPHADTGTAAAAARPGIGQTVDLNSLQSEGSSTAKVALIEFSDYECPFCATHALTVLGPLREQFVKTGKVRHVASNLPLPSHEHAKPLALAAICAGRQDRFWAMHDELFKSLPKTNESILDVARTLRLNAETLSACLKSREASAELERDLQQAKRLNVAATPTFIIGTINEKGFVTVEDTIVGSESITAFQTKINAALAKVRL